LIHMNLEIANQEVPDLREAIGWSRRDSDYPALFQRCTFWAGARDANGTLIAFGYVTGMGLEHGYMEDIIVHPQHQQQGIGQKLVTVLLTEANAQGLAIVTVTYVSEHKEFYERCGFQPSHAGIWRREPL